MSDQTNKDKRTRSSRPAGSRSAGSKPAGSSSSAKRKKSQTTGKRANRNGVLIIILTIIVIGAVIIGIITSFGRRSSGGSKPAADPSISVEENSTLEQNKHPEINELISNYRKAILEEDADLLKKVYNSDVEVNARILEGTSAIIESYNNSQYYTKPGMQGGEYVAYVYDDLKIRNVDTLVPNLSVFYVKTAEDGSMYLYRGDYNPQNGTFVMDTATQDYISTLYNDADVADLIASVNTKLESACAKDSKVMDFVDQIRGRTGVEPPAETGAASETETAGASETETQTETETETEAEVAE